MFNVKGTAMDRERNRRTAAEISLAAAAVQGSIAVQDFLPGAFRRERPRGSSL